MSADTIDDLHAAEDRIGSLLRMLADYTDHADDYCRPSCDADGPRDHCQSDPECCGCPCHDRHDEPDPADRNDTWQGPLAMPAWWTESAEIVRAVKP